MKERAKDLVREWPFVSQFDLTFFTIDQLLIDPEFAAWQFALRIQSRWVFGDDIRSRLPQYRATPDLAFALFNLETRIAKFRRRIIEEFDYSASLYWCSWVMRTLVRCGLELVIDREGRYTNELPLCYEVFSKYYPDKREAMRRALELSINPTASIESMLEIVEDIGAWIVQERKTHLGR
jgi:hypothetical protein